MGATAEAAYITDSAPSVATILTMVNDGEVGDRIARALETLDPVDMRPVIDISDALEDPAADAVIWHQAELSRDVLDQLSELRRLSESLAVVLIVDGATPRTARSASDSGADGLLLSEQIETVLAPTLSAVLVGQSVTPRELRPGTRAMYLSHREKQVLGMVVMGFTNSEIGARLFLAESTVKSHLSSAFRKLGVRSRSEASAMILDPDGSLGPGILALTPVENSTR